MTLDWNAIIIICTNLGALGIIGKWLMKGVTKSNENIPVMLQILATHSEGIKELFDSRNEMALNIREIQTGIDYCDSCNAHRHRRAEDDRSTVTPIRQNGA